MHMHVHMSSCACGLWDVCCVYEEIADIIIKPRINKPHFSGTEAARKSPRAN